MTKGDFVDIMTKDSAELSSKEHHTVAVAPFTRKEKLYLLSDLQRGDGAYDLFSSTLLSAVVTYEALFAFAMLIVSIVGLFIRKR